MWSVAYRDLMPISTQAYRPRDHDSPRVTLPALVSPDDQHAVEQFLYFEAQLLDEARYSDWMDLLADDVHYFMPHRRNLLHRELHRETSGPGELAHYDDDRSSLATRVRRLQQPTAWSDNPPPRTTRLIGGVQVQPGSDDHTFAARSVFHLYRNRLQNDADSFSGHRDDLLRRDEAVDGTRFQLVRRTIHLSQSVVLAKNLGVFF